MFDWWMGSPVHRDAILAADVTEAGAARVFAPGAPWGYYWTTVFARRAGTPRPYTVNVPIAMNGGGAGEDDYL
jgi:hypothetical protein